MLDNDGLHDLEPSELLTLLGLADVDHIVPYSALALPGLARQVTP